MSTLDRYKLDRFIIEALHEDIQGGDHTSQSCIPADQISRARLLVKDDGIISGVAIAERIFKYLDPESSIDIKLNDGSPVKYGDEAFYVSCRSQALLMGERLALNTMQRLSGISTLSRAFAEETKGYDVTILDTRKTTPLLRFLEKWAVEIGGCSNYRDGLYDRIMIKDNHVDAAGGITKAVERVQAYLSERNKKLEMTIEVRNFTELKEVLALNMDVRVMLDNFEIDNTYKAVQIVDKKFEVEASGGIELNNVRSVAATGVDFISVGALTHSAQCLDLSLKIMK